MVVVQRSPHNNPQARGTPPDACAGFLIDTSFNFLSVAAIKGVIDAMSYAKFNILHWHATDDPSWPITSAQYPNFTANGAFSSVAVYSLADQAAIRDYAAERGILILIELDMPGHAQIWKAGNPSYVISCPGGQTLLNPITASGIYDVISNLIAEYAQRFPGLPFIHLGACLPLVVCCAWVQQLRHRVVTLHLPAAPVQAATRSPR